MDRLNARHRTVTSRTGATVISQRDVRQVNGQTGSKKKVASMRRS
jgi:hypothetical protein